MGSKNNGLWSVIRIAIIGKKGEVGRLLFTTVTELAQDRPVPNSMEGMEHFALNNPENEFLTFRRIAMTRKDAEAWYLSLTEGVCDVPRSSNESEINEKDDFDKLCIPDLRDDQIWPNFGLPIRDNLFSSRGSDLPSIPFVSNGSERIHRRFSNDESPGVFDTFLANLKALKFISRRMYINFANYKEYLGSAAYIKPDPIIKSIDSFMVPEGDDHKEQIFYRITPRLNKNLEKLTLTTFDLEAELLTSFKSYKVPLDGIIIIIDKNVCMGKYGYVVTHEELGLLAYQPLYAFLRQTNINISISSNKKTKIIAPLNSTKNSPDMEYIAKQEKELVSRKVFGKVDENDSNILINKGIRDRERQSNIENCGQCWFPAGTEKEAKDFIHRQLKQAQKRIYIADPYLEPLQLVQFLFATSGKHMEVILFTSEKKASANFEEFKGYAKQLFNKQAFRLQLNTFKAKDLHDRFLVIDEDVWIIGSSLNSLGSNGAMVLKLPNPKEVIDILDDLRKNSNFHKLFE